MILPLALLAILQQPAPVRAEPAYFFFVASEGTDQVALVRYGPGGIVVQHRTTVRLVPGEPATPAEVYTDSLSGKSYALKSAHGLPPAELVAQPGHLAVAADGKAYFVTSRHGFPAGELVKAIIVGDSVRGWRSPDMLVGREPMHGTAGGLQVGGQNDYAFVVTRAPPDDRGESGITVVDARSMIEVATIPTCAVPLGAQLAPDRAHLYSLCAADDALVDVDLAQFKVARRLPLAATGGTACQPAALALVPGSATVAVACSGSHDLAIVDAASGAITRRIALGTPATGLLATPDAHALLVLHAVDSSVTIVPLAAGAPAERVALGASPTGAAASSDSRYLFVTLADGPTGVGSVATVDLAARRIVATAEYGRTLAAIAFWKVDR